MFGRPPILIGLDIGSHSVKAVQLKPVKDGFELVNYAVEPVQPDNPSEGSASSLKRLFDKGFFISNEVRISVSGPKVISRYIPFPKMTEAELKEALKFEAERYIPFKSDEVILDYIYDPNDIKNDKLYVMLVAAKRDLIAEKMKLVTDAGLKVSLIDIDSFCIANTYLFSNPKPDKNVAFLNIGESISNILLLSGPRACFTRDVEVVARTGSLDALSSELRISFDYFESQFEHAIDRLYLTGVVSDFDQVANYFKEGFGIGVARWDPTEHLTIGQLLDKGKLASSSGSLSIAIGLALRRA